jgi:hypothetical protein
VTITLGASCLVDFLGTVLQIDALAFSGLLLYLFQAPGWAFWTGILLLRGDAPFAPIKTQEEKR